MADKDEERKKFKTTWNIDHETNEIDDDNYNGAIKSNVGSQDDPTIEDWYDLINSGVGGYGDMLTNTLTSMATTSVSDIFTNLLTNAVSDEDVDSERPSGTALDKRFDDWLVKAKSYNYKNVKLTSTRGLYGANHTVLGGVIGLLTGAVGHTALSNFIDDAVVSNLPTNDSSVGTLLTNALGAGILEELTDTLSAWNEKGITLTELALLVASNYYNMYESRPGRQVRNAHNMYNFVVRGDSESKLGTTGTENETSKSGTDSTAVSLGLSTSTTSSAWKTISSAISGGWLSNLSSSASSDEDGESETIIIANEKDDYSQPIGEAISGERPKINGISYIGIQSVGLEDYVKKQTIGNNNLGVDEDTAIYSTVVERLNSYKKMGFLYIEPFLSGNDGIQQPFEIPFEFNPKFGSDTLEAKYNVEELMSRFLSLRTYTGTDAGTLTIEATYLALSPNDDSDSNINSNNYFEWMKTWTPKFIGQIEQAYRSLVFPYLDSSSQKFIRPPIIRIYPSVDMSDNPSLGDIDDKNKPIYTTVGNLYTYPLEGGSATNDKYEPIHVTGSLDGFRNMKRYIVTNVDISNISEDDWGNNYYATNYSGSSTDTSGSETTKNFALIQRRGFKVTLTLAETTKNFLDIIPSFSHYRAASRSVFSYGNTEANEVDSTNDDTLPEDKNLDFCSDELNVEGSNFLAFIYNI